MKLKIIVVALTLVSAPAFAGKCPEAQIEAASKSVVPAQYNCFLFAASELYANDNAERHRLYYRCTDAAERDMYNEVALRVDDAEAGLCMPTLITSLRKTSLLKIK
jgi:hypothetical protein